MSFGTLGATSSVAIGNAKDLLEILRTIAVMPDELKTEITALLETVVERDAAVQARETAVAAREQEAAHQEANVQAKQDALDEHVAKMRKLIG